MVVAFVRDEPTPSRSPAIGKSAIGSINERPTRCSTLKTAFSFFSFIADVPFIYSLYIKTGAPAAAFFCSLTEKLFKRSEFVITTTVTVL